MRTFLKRVLKAIQEKNVELALTEFNKASSVLDKLASKRVIHKNKAARHKSRLSAHIKNIQS